jgi:hypothetical protein
MNYNTFLFQEAGAIATDAGAGHSIVSGIVGDTPTPAATTTTTEAPDYHKYVGKDGALSDGWENLVDEGYRGTVKGTKTVGDLVKRLHDNQAAARAKSEGMLRVPGDDATPEQLADFRRALGVPEKPEDYGITKPAELPEGVEWDDELVGNFTKFAHETGLPPKQAKAAVEWHAKAMAAKAEKGREELSTFLQDQTKQVLEHFGNDKGKAAEQIGGILKEAEQYGITPHSADLLSAGTWKYMLAVRGERDELAVKVKALTGEDVVTGRGKGGTVVANPRAEAKAIMSEPGWHKDAAKQAKVNELYALAAAQG